MMKYIKILLNRNAIWILGTLAILAILTVLLIQQVERGVKDAKKFVATHEIVMPKE